jgi:hypothetical protein
MKKFIVGFSDMVINLFLRISLQIFLKIQNCLLAIAPPPPPITLTHRFSPSTPPILLFYPTNSAPSLPLERACPC